MSKWAACLCSNPYKAFFFLLLLFGFSFLRYICGGGEDSRKRSVMRESAMAEKLLDFTQPFDVGLLDATVAAFYGTGSKHEVSSYANLEGF